MITLSSDFGWPYPASMKGVILQESDARIVDITHQFPRQDVTAAAFWLREVLPYFPPAVHCAVVDPGVGTDRAAVVVRAGDHAIVAPDNGLAMPAARRLADDVEVFRIEDADPESTTFHGRDVFAPAAATVHEAGVDAFHEDAAFSAFEDYTDRTFPDPTEREDGVTGEVLVVDGFGNVVTNIPGEHIADRFGESVTVNGAWAPLRRTYGAVEEGNRLATIGSHGYLELAVNQGRGDKRFSLSPGARVRLKWA
jgi:S-adenosylmethionine hydrolase